MTSSPQKFDLHLPGLIRVLAEHLYSDPRVGLRELLQNSHDSISRRAIEQADWDQAPRIDVRINKNKHILEIKDNGSGLTKEEVIAYLSTIGRGYTRQLRQDLALQEPLLDQTLIGQFGLGFLSAFMLGESVVVETKSFQNGHKAVTWQSDGSESYRLTTGRRTTVGTTVRLTLKPAMRHLLDEPTLDRQVKRFADLLPHPIFVGKASLRSNLGHPPWKRGAAGTAESAGIEAAIIAFLRTREISDDPIWVLPLTDHKRSVGHDSVHIPLSGVIYIPERSRASLQEHGDATVFIRSMLICERDRRLLPKWARFASAIVESPMLQPTASREDIHEDENLEWVADAIEEQLLAGLERLCQDTPHRWHAVLDSHADLIMAWAAEHQGFFRRVADAIRLPTSRGRLSIPDYLRQSKQKILYYQINDTPRLCEQVILEGCGKPVIDASWFGVLPFLEKYAQEHTEVRLVQAESDIHSLIREIRSKKYIPLTEIFKQLEPRVKMGEFDPEDLPAILLYSPNAEFIRDARQAVHDDALIPGVAEMLAGCASELRAEGESEEGILYLNAKSPLIQRLAQLASTAQLELNICEALYQATKIFSGRMLDARQCMTAFGKFSQSLQELIR
ncbi:ATP-binding protein [Planctomycetaceae bacterium SH139]